MLAEPLLLHTPTHAAAQTLHKRSAHNTQHAGCCGPQPPPAYTSCMPCAAGELCQHLSDAALSTAELSCCGPCGDRLHRICGEIYNPDNDEDMNRICQSCATAKTSASSTSDRSKAAERKEGGGFLKQNPPKKRQGEVRKRLTLGQKREKNYARYWRISTSSRVTLPILPPSRRPRLGQSWRSSLIFWTARKLRRVLRHQWSRVLSS